MYEKYMYVKSIGLKYMPVLDPVYIFVNSCLCGLAIYINYRTSLFNVLHSLDGSFHAFIITYCIYLLAFAIPYLLQVFFYKEVIFLRNKWVAAAILLLPFAFAIRTSFIHGYTLFHGRTAESVVLLQIFNWIVRAAFLIALCYAFTYRQKHALQTVPTNNKKLYVYAWMLLCFTPVVFMASLLPSFRQIYPRAEIISGIGFRPKALYYVAFELSYILDIFSIELFFRGLLVIAFIRYCGTRCIIPAACFYCCIHFNKPAGEAISSFFGAILLGFIAYRSRNIRGSIILHVGITMLMEGTAFLARVAQYHP